jgi:hypothetical protein
VTPGVVSAVKNCLSFLKNLVGTGLKLLYKKPEKLAKDLNLKNMLDIALSNIVGFSDADFGVNLHAISGSVFYVFGLPFAWNAKKQTVISTSTCESEYIALFGLVKEYIFLRLFLCELFLQDADSVKTKSRLRCDNQSSLKITEFNVATKHSKHFTIKYNYIYSLKKHFLLDYIESLKNKANPFTKPPTQTEVQWFMHKLHSA